LDELTTETADRESVGTAPRVFELYSPAEQSAPVVFASPHSGRDYLPEFIAQSRLDAVTIRRSEDAFVDEIFAAAPDCGAPLLCALFPRAYVDPNREAFEFDPAMFAEPLPDYVRTKSARIAAGLGTVARVVTNGAEIYEKPISFADAKARVENFYFPYHQKLTELVTTTRDRFGACLLIDCHSMPSFGGPMDRDSGRHRVDFILCDNHGAACAPEIVDVVEDELKALGYVVHRNNPYSGGYTTREYGRPAERVHALQIEINRACYMNEETMERGSRMPDLIATVERLVATITSPEVEKLILS
jgi:N-formylglutamate amidohydrolase